MHRKMVDRAAHALPRPVPPAKAESDFLRGITKKTWMFKDALRYIVSSYHGTPGQLDFNGLSAKAKGTRSERHPTGLPFLVGTILCGHQYHSTKKGERNVIVWCISRFLPV